MRKQITKQDNGAVSVANQQWLNVEYLAKVEVSSEDEAHPIESALTPSAGLGWRAGQPGLRELQETFYPNFVRFTDSPMQLNRSS